MALRELTSTHWFQPELDETATFTLRREKQGYFSENTTQDQRGLNPGRMHDRSSSQALCQCATSPYYFTYLIADAPLSTSHRVLVECLIINSRVVNYSPTRIFQHIIIIYCELRWRPWGAYYKES